MKRLFGWKYWVEMRFINGNMVYGSDYHIFNVETESEAITLLLEWVKIQLKYQPKKIIKLESLGKFAITKYSDCTDIYRDTNWSIEDHVDLETYLENRLIRIE